MRSWKTPALLATVGLCGLGSLLAQDAPLPVQSGLPLVNESAQPLNFDPSVRAPETSGLVPVVESQPPVEYTPGSSVMDNSSVIHDTWMSSPAPSASCGCANPAPQSMLAPCQSDCGRAAPVSSCGCQGGSMSSGGFGQYGGGSYRATYPMGSGSGVSSGVLSPNANSGGLHTRYPYYNYRHPWYYQGPPSQNVTIVW